VVYPGAGHLLHVEEPGLMASDLAAFIAELEIGSV
jgi:pimeloyl-ACP methyl ester carboxylesterase